MLLMKQWIQFAESNGHEDAGSMILVKQDIVTAATDNHKQILATTELNADSALEV